MLALVDLSLSPNTWSMIGSDKQPHIFRTPYALPRTSDLSHTCTTAVL